MEPHISRRPQAGTYAQYYGRYIDMVPDGDIVRLMRLSAFEAIVFLESIPGDRWDFRYAEQKWSVKEAVLHIIDTERVMAYRALRFARGDQAALPGFDQDAYVPASIAGLRSPESLIAEFKAVRDASLALFDNLPAEAWDRQGTASQNTFSVRALAYIVVGHELHHREILRQRYLSPVI